ncbi:uncharacterized protein LAESUDRAFT_736010 [Laetiporus sulphureus 93-53]|uniref:DUF7770 domain-containing protein n=1 Tax=Laetiporus sulphureus 93-53 TaxID=1314785 RepID=A0A165F6X3_9APHY|nr:uncharacterized protein LAESUDRAFT_736010 [Laetiporus sulphureus 93-53]KZT08505.1 hypothetical protein LAESUDRAFT_736010 [Laetiporus sulphureus 93-53]
MATGVQCVLIHYHLHPPVFYIHFIAHQNLHNDPSCDGQPPTNHWTLFLQTIVPGEVGRPGMVVREDETCKFTDDHIYKVSTEAACGITVENILTVIIKHKRDNYIFAPIGEGCGYWLHTLALDLANASIISTSAANEARVALTKYWPYLPGTAPQERAMAVGRFF